MASTASPAATAPTAHKTTLTDTIRDTFSGDAPLTEKFRSFYKAKPVAAIALGTVAAIAIINTLRGK